MFRAFNLSSKYGRSKAEKILLTYQTFAISVKVPTPYTTQPPCHNCVAILGVVVVDLYTKYEVSILNGCGDIFDKKVLRNYGRTDGRTDGTTDRCKPVYPPLFQSGGIIKGMPQRGQILSCKCTTSHALGAQCNQWNVDYHIHPTLFCSGFKLCRTIFEN